MPQPAEPPPALREWLQSGGTRTRPAPPPAAVATTTTASRKRWDAPGGRPDPRHVAHVTVDQHLAVLDRMEEAERRSSELVQEREELRRQCREAKSEAAQSRSDRDRIARDIEAVIHERDRLLSQSS